MRCLWLIGTLCLAGTAMAEATGDYAFGLSGGVDDGRQETVTGWLLQQQRQSPEAKQSELPAPLYVDTQRRIGDTFKRRIPDSLKEEARLQEAR